MHLKNVVLKISEFYSGLKVLKVPVQRHTHSHRQYITANLLPLD